MAKSREKQLHTSLPEDFEVPDHVDLMDKVVPRKAKSLPFMYWPDGVPCVEANVFMRSLLHAGKSRRNRGGSLKTYASHISHLIRYCHKNGWNFSDLDDNKFTMFIRNLQARDALGNEVRNANQVRNIGRTCINFLRTLQTFMGIDYLIGEKGQGCAITVEEREIKIQVGKGKTHSKWFFCHDSFPSASPLKERHPISNDVVKKLEAAARSIPNRSKRARTLLMLNCLKLTGGRRAEIANIRVKDIETARAADGGSHMLRLVTLKQGGEGDDEEKEKIRYVPVPKHVIQEAMKYIQRHRRRMIRQKIKSKSPKTISEDHGYLLISEITGNKLAIDTVTTELSKLCAAAGITDEPAHAHLFRHAFITQLLVMMIKQDKIINKDDFRSRLLNEEAFKRKLQQWTGHSELSSLERYIDLAFTELGNVGKVYKAVTLGRAVGAVQTRLDNLRAEIQAGDATLPELLEELEELIETFQDDIDASTDSEAANTN
ncbi:site-specific integrase [Photobacterium sagamiensis]|uniref:tyrosine-type recombinase/integrase n=1 Tax=Photobacterium sagamiensis TaxID=2910241 RepID=UPI003D0FDD82